MPTLKEIREAKGLSLVEVGRATGLHDTTVSKVERGLIRLTPRVYYLLTKFYVLLVSSLISSRSCSVCWQVF